MATAYTKAHKHGLVVPNLVPGMHVKNVSQIKRLDGRDRPGTTLQTGRKQRQLVLVGFHSRASICASAICVGVIFAATAAPHANQSTKIDSR
jgi:hypothetical protein